jgi:hypothetical protein
VIIAGVIIGFLGFAFGLRVWGIAMVVYTIVLLLRLEQYKKALIIAHLSQRVTEAILADELAFQNLESPEPLPSSLPALANHVAKLLATRDQCVVQRGEIWRPCCRSRVGLSHLSECHWGGL